MQPDDSEHPLNILIRYALEIRGNFQVFLCRQMPIAGRGFDQRSRLRKQLQAVWVAHPLAQQGHGAARWLRQPEQHLHGGGFPRAVRADKAVYAALRHRQIHAVYNHGFPIHFAQLLGFDGIGHVLTPCLFPCFMPASRRMPQIRRASAARPAQGKV